MSVLYWILGSGVGLAALLLYLNHKVKQNQTLTDINAILEKKKDYRDEVIDQLSTPQSIDDTLDSLRKGEF